MADSLALTAAALKQIIDTEFAPELITAKHDKLHESRGWEGTEVGIYPERKRNMMGKGNVRELLLKVQFYGLWDKQIDPTQTIDPSIVTGFADRFERAVEGQQATFVGTDDVWFFLVDEIAFPDDPTGNKTRFEASIRAFGDNTALTQR